MRWLVLLAGLPSPLASLAGCVSIPPPVHATFEQTTECGLSNFCPKARPSGEATAAAPAPPSPPAAAATTAAQEPSPVAPPPPATEVATPAPAPPPPPAATGGP